ARQLMRPLAVRGSAGVSTELAVRHLHGAPGQAATALCGIVASTALMIAMAVMVTSFRIAVDDWLQDVLSADLYMRVDGGAGFDPAAQRLLAATPGVAEIVFMRQIPLTIAPDEPPLSLQARPITKDWAGDSMMQASSDPAPTGFVPVWISEPAARLHGWRIGDRLNLPIGHGARFVVMGIWRDYARQQGAATIDSADYDRLTGDVDRHLAAVTLVPGASAQRVTEALGARLPAALIGTVGIKDTRTLRREVLKLFDRSFAVTYVLEGISIVVGLIGVGATMSAQTIARSREFGMLRHIGLGKRQIIAMLASEGALLGLVGGLAGIFLGGIMAQVLIHVINPQSFNWTMTTRWPVGMMISVAGALIVASAGTAILAGRRAIATDAVRAVREDW
ncbi:MAG: hypothetical protein JWR77_1472, partial [Rhizorhabdus sp.]|nr:hypothetical protein [Rhizorhabdus sp.]